MVGLFFCLQFPILRVGFDSEKIPGKNQPKEPTVDKKIVGKAQSLAGCLAQLKTVSGRRRHAHDEDVFVLDSTFAGDEARILSCKKFRLLGNMTQVVVSPATLLTRNREAHTLEVAACSVVASDLLGLNRDLARAIALGHDIGHVPFGHLGESFMAKVMKRPKFCHEVMGVVIAQKIERSGKGLNLTHETLEGMAKHSSSTAAKDMSQEAWVVRWTDKFAYIFHDYNDICERMRCPVPGELHHLVNKFGASQRERTTSVIAALVVESAEFGRVSFEHSEMAKDFARLRALMYEVYQRVVQQDPRETLEPVLEFLRQLKIGDPFLLLALMTDQDVLHMAAQPMKNLAHLQQTAVAEIIPHLEKIGKVNLCDPDLDW
jgi:dGTPase